jgi:hypothetical protein
VLQRTPLEEKKRLRAQMQEQGNYKGFKLRNYYEWAGRGAGGRADAAARRFGGVTDKIEQFNWYRDMKSQEPGRSCRSLMRLRVYRDCA